MQGNEKLYDVLKLLHEYTKERLSAKTESLSFYLPKKGIEILMMLPPPDFELKSLSAANILRYKYLELESVKKG